jgi:uncharacterized phage protein (TIGR01671 family)
MREILFRGKRIDNGEWVEGGIVHQTDFYGDSIDRYFIIDGTETDDVIGPAYQVDTSTISEFTGLTDKNGKKIFEGDIVSCVAYIGMGYREKRGKVVYQAPEFLVDCKHHNVMIFSQYAAENKDLEVIGNIHDNPELLEDKP